MLDGVGELAVPTARPRPDQFGRQRHSQQRRDRLGVEGAVVVEALGQVAAPLPQALALLGRLDALGDGAQLQGVGQLDDGAGQGRRRRGRAPTRTTGRS